MPGLDSLVTRSKARGDHRAALTAFFAPLASVTPEEAAEARTETVRRRLIALSAVDRARGEAVRVLIERVVQLADGASDPKIAAAVKQTVAVLASVSPICTSQRVSSSAMSGSIASQDVASAITLVESRPEVMRAMRWDTSVDIGATAAARNSQSLHLAHTITATHSTVAAEGAWDHRMAASGKPEETRLEPPPAASISDRRPYWRLKRELDEHPEESGDRAMTPESGYVDIESQPSPPHDVMPTRRTQHGSKDASETRLCMSAFRSNVVHPRAVKPLVIAAHRAVLGLSDPFGFVVAVGDVTGPEDTRQQLLAVRDDLPAMLSFASPLLLKCVECGNTMRSLQQLVAHGTRPGMRAALGSYGAAQMHALEAALVRIREAVLASLDERLGASACDFDDAMRCILSLQRNQVRDVLRHAELFGIESAADWRLDDSIARCGVGLLGALHVDAESGDGLVARSMLHKCIAPFAQHLGRWLTFGIVEDPFDEFFIVPSTDALAEVAVDTADERRPFFVTIVAAESIVDAGIAMRTLRRVLGSSLLERSFVHSVLVTALWDSDWESDLADSSRDAVLRAVRGCTLAARFRAAFTLWANALSQHIETLVFRGIALMKHDFETTYESALLQGNRIRRQQLSEAALAEHDQQQKRDARTEDAGQESPYASLGESPAAAAGGGAAVEPPGHAGDAVSVAMSTSTAADTWREFMDEAKEIARQRILEEHERRMKVAELRALRIDWKARRLALSAKRREALVTQIDEIDRTLAEAEGDCRDGVVLPVHDDLGSEASPSASAATYGESDAAPGVDGAVHAPVAAADDVPTMPSGTTLQDSLAARHAPSPPPQPWDAAAAAAGTSPGPVRNDDDAALIEAERHDEDDEATNEVPSGTVVDALDVASAQEEEVEQPRASAHDDSHADEGQLATDDEAPPHVAEHDEFVRPNGRHDIDDEEIASQHSTASSYDEAAVLNVYPSYLPEVDDPKRPLGPSEAGQILSDRELRHRGLMPASMRDHFADDPGAALDRAVGEYVALPPPSFASNETQRGRAERVGSGEELSAEALTAIEAANGHVAQDLQTVFADIAEEARRRITAIAVRALLCPFVPVARHVLPGLLGAVIRGLIDAFLLQASVPANDCVDAWVLANFTLSHGAQKLQAYEADVAFLGMTRAWDALWNRVALPVGVPSPQAKARLKEFVPQDWLPIRVSLRSGAQDPPRSPFDLLGNTAFHFDVSPKFSEAWLMPLDFGERYSYVFKTLMFWRYAHHVATTVWSAGSSLKSPAVWRFANAVRSIVAAVGSHIWHATSAAATEFLAAIDPDAAASNWRSIERFRAEHDEFLAACHAACLLSPNHTKPRRTLHGIVRMLLEVHQSCLGGAQPDMLKRFVLKRSKDVADAVQLVVRQLRECGDLGSDIASFVGALQATVPAA